jgi:hypothetical protein
LKAGCCGSEKKAVLKIKIQAQPSFVKKITALFLQESFNL